VKTVLSEVDEEKADADASNLEDELLYSDDEDNNYVAQSGKPDKSLSVDGRKPDGSPSNSISRSFSSLREVNSEDDFEHLRIPSEVEQKVSGAQNEQAGATEKGGSMIDRVKRNLASRTCNTRVGRKAVGHFIGEGGMAVINNLKKAAAKDRGEKFAQQLKLVAMKSAVKAKLLIDNKKLSLNNFSRLTNFSVQITYGLNHILQLDEAKRKLSLSKYIEELSEIFSQFCVECVTVFQRHMSSNNLNAMRDTINYWGGRHFLIYFVDNSACASEMSEVKTVISDIISKRATEDQRIIGDPARPRTTSLLSKMLSNTAGHTK